LESEDVQRSAIVSQILDVYAFTYDDKSSLENPRTPMFVPFSGVLSERISTNTVVRTSEEFHVMNGTNISRDISDNNSDAALIPIHHIKKRKNQERKL